MVWLLRAASCRFASATSSTRRGDVDRLAPDGDVERIRHGVGDEIVDHLGELVGGVADIGELRQHVFVGRAGARRSSPSMISVRPRITPSGFFRSWATVPRISLLKVLACRSRAHCAASRRLAAVRSCVRCGDALLEAGVRALQLLVQNDVVEGDRQPAAEDLDQRAVGVGEVARRFEHDHDLAAAQRPDVEHRARAPRIRAGGA